MTVKALILGFDGLLTDTETTPLESRRWECVTVPDPHADPARFAHADLLLASAADLPLDAALARLP